MRATGAEVCSGGVVGFDGVLEAFLETHLFNTEVTLEGIEFDAEHAGILLMTQGEPEIGRESEGDPLYGGGIVGLRRGELSALKRKCG